MGKLNIEQIEDLFKFLEHGDEKHRIWLKAAISAFFNNKPRPKEQ